MKTRFIVPLAIFGIMVVLFWFALVQMNKGEYNPRDIPSPLVGKAVPSFDLSQVNNAEARLVSPSIFANHPVSLFNVWASWCVACRQEHGFLMELSRNGVIPLYGLNYKDERADARQWLSEWGDPYVASGWDIDGKVGIDWGVYGVPETFVVDSKGMIRYKHIGPVTPESWEKKIWPVIQQVRAEGV